MRRASSVTVRRQSVRQLITLQAAVAGMVGASAAFAAVPPPTTQPVAWDGEAGDGRYVNPTNWNPNLAAAPANADNQFLQINNGGTAVVAAGDNAEGAFLHLGLRPGDSGNLQVTGGTLTLGEFRVGGRDTIPSNLADWSQGVAGNGGGTGTVLQTGGTVNVTFTHGTDPNSTPPGANFEPPIQSMYIGDSGLDSGNTANGTYHITSGALNVGIATSDHLAVGTGPGAVGAFIQDGGDVHSFGRVTLARRGATATWDMAAGTLQVDADFFIGNGEDNAAITGTNGAFTQTGGTVTSTLTTIVGRERGTGSYTITGGSLTATTNLNVGVGGTGTFVQGNTTTNPNSTVTSTRSMTIGLRGATAAGTGSYTLNSGTLNVGQSNDVLAIGNGVGSKGTLVQNGGSITTGGNFQLGRNNSAEDNTYTLKAGSLTANAEIWIGGGPASSGTATAGTGTVTQDGGTVSAATNVHVGGTSSLNVAQTTLGTYNLNAGSLTLTRTSAGAVLAIGNGLGATGTFNQTGGTLTNKAHTAAITDVGRNTGVGTYNLSGTGVLDTTQLRLGASSSNKFNLSGNATATIGTLTVGGGVVTLSGGTSTVTTTNLNTGSLTVSGGTHTLGTLATNTGTLTLNNVSPALTSLNLSSGSKLVTSGTVALAAPVGVGTATVQVDNGSLSLAGALTIASGGRTITKTGPGTLTLSGSSSHANSTSHLGLTVNQGSVNVAFNPAGPVGLTVASGASVVATAGGNKVLNARIFSLTPGGTIDLNDNDMVVQYDPTASPAVPSQYPVLFAALQSAYQNGAWTGAGLTSASAKNNANKITTLAVVDTATTPAGTYTSFDGVGVDDTTVLVKYTYYGDADLDGDVDAADFGLIGSTTGWRGGDFNHDGRAGTPDDYALANLAAALQGAPLSSAVPEPAALPALAVGAGLLAARRRRRS